MLPKNYKYRFILKNKWFIFSAILICWIAVFGVSPGRAVACPAGYKAVIENTTDMPPCCSLERLYYFVRPLPTPLSVPSNTCHCWPHPQAESGAAAFSTIPRLSTQFAHANATDFSIARLLILGKHITFCAIYINNLSILLQKSSLLI